MPRRALKVCCVPGCPELVRGPASRCDEHERERRRANDARRPNFRQRQYTTAWDRRRKAFLGRNPVCVRCGAPSVVADHLETRAVLVARGVEDPDADEHLIPLCRRCHSIVTGRFDGGFGRPVDTAGKRRWLAGEDA